MKIKYLFLLFLSIFMLSGCSKEYKVLKKYKIEKQELYKLETVTKISHSLPEDATNIKEESYIIFWNKVGKIRVPVYGKRYKYDIKEWILKKEISKIYNNNKNNEISPEFLEYKKDIENNEAKIETTFEYMISAELINGEKTKEINIDKDMFEKLKIGESIEIEYSLDLFSN